MPKQFLMHLLARASVCVFPILAALPVASVAQTVSRYQDQNQLIRAPQALAGLGADLFGDKVNLYTGALEAHQYRIGRHANVALYLRHFDAPSATFESDPAGPIKLVAIGNLPSCKGTGISKWRQLRGQRILRYRFDFGLFATSIGGTR